MAAIPFMPLYVADYMADAAHLSMEEHGAYMLLLMTYWQRGKPLPNDDERLARICRTDVERWLNVRSAVVEFFDLKDGELRHKRVEQELKKVRAKSVKAKNAGKLSGLARRQATENIEKTNGRSANDEQTLNHTDTDTDTDTERKKKKVSVDKSTGGEPPIESLEMRLFREGKDLLGKASGGVITKLRKHCEYDDGKALRIMDEASGKHDPAQWLHGVMRKDHERIPTMDEICPPHIYGTLDR